VDGSGGPLSAFRCRGGSHKLMQAGQHCRLLTCPWGLHHLCPLSLSQSGFRHPILLDALTACHCSQSSLPPGGVSVPPLLAMLPPLPHITVWQQLDICEQSMPLYEWLAPPCKGMQLL